MGSTNSGSSSTFLRWQLGIMLKGLREQAGKSQEGVALTGIASDVTLWRLENGKTPPNFLMVRALCEHYEADAVTSQRLVEMARAAKEGRAWFERAGDDSVPPALRMYLGAELMASSLRIYDSEVVPGALQTEEYARALFVGEKPDASQERIDQLVAMRLQRQEQYWRSRPESATLCIILGEAALARDVGGHGAMMRQVDHLREVSGRRRSEVMILPYEVGSHPAIYGGFSIFDFTDRAGPTVVYTEGYSGGSYIDEEGDVRDMTNRWNRMLSLSKQIKECTFT